MNFDVMCDDADAFELHPKGCGVSQCQQVKVRPGSKKKQGERRKGGDLTLKRHR